MFRCQTSVPWTIIHVPWISIPLPCNRVQVLERGTYYYLVLLCVGQSDKKKLTSPKKRENFRILNILIRGRGWGSWGDVRWRIHIASISLHLYLSHIYISKRRDHPYVSTMILLLLFFFSLHPPPPMLRVWMTTLH